MKEKIIGVVLCFIVLYFIFPVSAFASMTKIFSVFEALVPPAILWAGFAVIWYSAVALMATWHGESIGGIYPMPKSVITLGWVSILSLTMIGPLGIIYLLSFFPAVTLRAFRFSDHPPMSKPLAALLKRVSVVSILLLAGLICASIYIHQHRSKDDFHQLLTSPQTVQKESFFKKWS